MKKTDRRIPADREIETPSDIRKRNFRMAHPTLSRRANEKFHATIGRIMEEKNFANLDEANAYLEKNIIGRKVPDLPPRNALEEAQDIMYSAWEEPSKKKRIMMARRALEISADCADAFVLLAEESASSLADARDCYERGTQAGERALGPEAFKKEAGHFWGVIETRPYMRARAGLAGVLWHMGEKAAAISHYHDMLRLNPNDNQGLRYPLLGYLLEENRDREARELMDRFPGEGSAAWLYSKALLKFKREGPNPKTDGRLMKALDYNPAVVLYLLGMKNLPKRIPETVGIGDDDEAVEYVAGSFRGWFQTPGALEWLARIAAVFLKVPEKRPAN
jgi:tetratricopeptide (TPR) repeat protein